MSVGSSRRPNITISEPQNMPQCHPLFEVPDTTPRFRVGDKQEA